MAGCHGARFVLHRSVTGFVRSHDRIAAVLLDDGTRIDTDVVVNAAGPWSSQINELADDTTPGRVRAAHTGATIDLSAFSRRRPVSTESSGTVMG